MRPECWGCGSDHDPGDCDLGKKARHFWTPGLGAAIDLALTTEPGPEWTTIGYITGDGVALTADTNKENTMTATTENTRIRYSEAQLTGDPVALVANAYDPDMENRYSNRLRFTRHGTALHVALNDETSGANVNPGDVVEALVGLGILAEGTTVAPPAWHEALVVRADYRGERVVMAKDEDGDFYGIGKGADAGYSYEHSGYQGMSNVEILVGKEA